ncbi:anthranilate synthase component I [Taibaiella sp. KBW10]|uniref:anthranilate synthase component I family protein n=1 Tax=Taibaiella sp. KBW10 TaxID=2153357 RepID=UPI000F591B00|nr:anthranilate synthase component I family protein [Taibaiella sp. KBW10]RQO29821.1 anthranilate synthase component I [Taibaiella sp. KBW10]
MHYAIACRIHKRLADTETPISVYLKLRDHFAETLLMESADHSNPENDFSYICCAPIAGISLSGNILEHKFPDGHNIRKEMTADINLVQEIDDYLNRFAVAEHPYHFDVNGLFGYLNYDTVRYFENITLDATKPSLKQIPDVRLNLYHFVIVFDHFRNELYIVVLGDPEQAEQDIALIAQYIDHRSVPSYPFKTTAAERSNFEDEAFLEVIEKGRQHCFRGDVFQVVLSREFETPFSGDDFNVYRALRSINPSQYLFYYDYGSYRLMGSSPEAQLKIREGKASIHPIAGTYRRTGNKEEDLKLAIALKADKKENAEHTMLIDLARNDLSKCFGKVSVTALKELLFYSHVIHMVSEVTGADPVSATAKFGVVADTFPAGTLSGAPKHKAMQLIDRYEPTARGYYGGSIGYVGFDGNFNQAIMIRSFLSKDHTLYYRAGAGVVAASVAKNELMEVNHKIAALRKAIEAAQNLFI